MAAEQGSAVAQHNIGYLYFSGEGLDQDYAEAFYWFKLAAEQGYPPAAGNLGQMYYDGLGVEVDKIEAYAWLATALAQGLDVSEIFLDDLLLSLSYRDMLKAQALAREYKRKYVIS